MKRMIAAIVLAFGFVVIGHPMVESDVHAQGWTAMWRITVTNLTYSQAFTPILAATHGHNTLIFTPGTAASAELQALAEGGDTVPLAMALSNKSMSVETTAGLLLPGQTAEIIVTGGSMYRYLSLVSMLIPTNDGFVGLSVELASHPKMVQYYAYAYDAGTEMNDESCASIPGPHMECQGGMGTNGSPGGGEGVVLIHRGIQGVGDFGPDNDWRNPVARVTIRRVS